MRENIAPGAARIPPPPKGIRRTLAAATLVAAGILGTGMLHSVAQAAPLNYSGGSIGSNFDWLPTNVTNPAVQVITGRGPHEFSVVTGAISPGRDGWQLANPAGSSSNTEFRAQDGSIAGGSGGRGVNSFGDNGSTERALGMAETSNQINTFGLVLQNTSAQTYIGFDISFVGEQWRRGDAGVSTMSFDYGLAANIGSGGLINVPALAWTSPNTQVAPTNVALNGNLPANQVNKSSTIVGLNWLPGQTLVLKWSIDQVSGQDDGLGIDNFTFSAAAVPEPSTLALGMLAAVGLAVTTFRRRMARG